MSVPCRSTEETRHQLDGPFVLDGSAATATFGLWATPFETGIRASIDAEVVALQPVG